VLVTRDGKLTGEVTGPLVDAAGKAEHVRLLKKEYGIPPRAVLAIGDGANDLPMMAEAGTSIAYHAKPVVKERATYALDFAGLEGVLNLFG
jgi:phosphoserine phosphatase